MNQAPVALDELVEETLHIPTIPSLLREARELFESGDAAIGEVARLIERDPALSATTLRLVNSPFFGVDEPICSIPVACRLLGLSVLEKTLHEAKALSESAEERSFGRFDPRMLWDHSFKAARAARLLVMASKMELGIYKDTAFTCGLLHDVGKIVMLDREPEKFLEALRLSEELECPLYLAEAEVFGFTHAQVGGRLTEKWGLSGPVHAAVMYHHSPATNAEQWVQGFVVKAASTIAHRSSQQTRRESGHRGDLLDADAMSALFLSEEQIGHVTQVVDSTQIDW